jgi:hypothetical protein
MQCLICLISRIFHQYPCFCLFSLSLSSLFPATLPAEAASSLLPPAVAAPNATWLIRAADSCWLTDAPPEALACYAHFYAELSEELQCVALALVQPSWAAQVAFRADQHEWTLRSQQKRAGSASASASSAAISSADPYAQQLSGLGAAVAGGFDAGFGMEHVAAIASAAAREAAAVGTAAGSGSGSGTGSGSGNSGSSGSAGVGGTNQHDLAAATHAIMMAATGMGAVTYCPVAAGPAALLSALPFFAFTAALNAVAANDHLPSLHVRSASVLLFGDARGLSGERIMEHCDGHSYLKISKII